VLLGKFLGDAGFQVDFATGAKEGFDKVRALTPDCILCDVTLPDIDGFWVARRVRTEPTAVATTPFLFLTDAEDAESRLQGLHVGADVYITKPFRNEEVVAQVTALIEMVNRLKKQRRRFAHLHDEVEILERHFARAATTGRRGRTGLRGAPAEAQQIDFVLVLRILGFAFDAVEFEEIISCHLPGSPTEDDEW